MYNVSGFFNLCTISYAIGPDDNVTSKLKKGIFYEFYKMIFDLFHSLFVTCYRFRIYVSKYGFSDCNMNDYTKKSYSCLDNYPKTVKIILIKKDSKTGNRHVNCNTRN